MNFLCIIKLFLKRIKKESEPKKISNIEIVPEDLLRRFKEGK